MARLTARSAAFAPIILLALCAGQAACLAAPPGAGNAAAPVIRKSRRDMGGRFGVVMGQSDFTQGAAAA